MAALTKETFTGEQHLKQQLDTLRKYIYNVGQRYPEENKEQRIEGIPFALKTMETAIDDVVRLRGKECDALNSKFGGKTGL